MGLFVNFSLKRRQYPMDSPATHHRWFLFSFNSSLVNCKLNEAVTFLNNTYTMPVSERNSYAYCYRPQVLRWQQEPKQPYRFCTRNIIFSSRAITKKKLHGLSPRANYTDRATAVCRRSDCKLVRIEGATWSA
jgi:hypothetical protein